MAYFSYRAVDGDSRVIKGRLEASDEEELEARLTSQGLILIEATASLFGGLRRSGLPGKDLLNFTYLLHLIFTSGISVMSGLSDMAGQSVSRRVSAAASRLRAEIEAGKSISEAMAGAPETFPVYYSSMVRAGELSGKMEQVLDDLMRYIEWQIQLKKDVRTALAYPVMVLSAVLLFVLILFSFVIPKLMNILAGLKVDLPLPTKVLITTVGFVKTYWFLVILFPLFVVIAFHLARRSEAGRMFIDRSVLKIPLLGGLLRKLNHSRYFKTFATLYRAGLNMHDTLRISADVVKNRAAAGTFHRVAQAVLGGEQFSKVLRDTGEFAPLLVNMVEIGEKTGTLDNTLFRISDTYDKEIPETLKSVFAVIEPLIIILLGGLVLLTLASFFLPLYKIVGGIRR